jgi:hypothetical protein
MAVATNSVATLEIGTRVLLDFGGGESGEFIKGQLYLSN